MLSRSFFSLSLPATCTTNLSTLSLHDALPIFVLVCRPRRRSPNSSASSDRSSSAVRGRSSEPIHTRDRKSTRLNSSHVAISYAVFCLKTKTNNQTSNNPFKTYDERIEISEYYI